MQYLWGEKARLDRNLGGALNLMAHILTRNKWIKSIYTAQRT